MRQIKYKIFLFISFLFVQLFLYSSGLETKGIGARARGMGFALVSLTDDWSLVHYNPAGVAMIDDNLFGSEYEFFTGSLDSTSSLRNLKPFSANVQRGDFVDFIGDEPLTFNEKNIDSDIHFGAFGFVIHKDPLSYGIGFYGSGSGTAWEDSIQSAIGDPISAEVSFTNGSLNVPFVISYKVNEDLAIGCTLGFQWGLLKVENKKIRSGFIPYQSTIVQDTDGIGFNFNTGILWKPTKIMNIGAVIKFPYTFTKKGETEINQSLLRLSVKSDTEVDMEYPLRIALGASWQLTPKDLFAVNATWLNWSKYNMNIDYTNQIPGIFDNYSGNPSNWEDAWVLNAGYEKILNEKWTVRSGITYDQAPEPADSRILTGGQVIDVWLFSFGAGRKLKNAYIDFGYIYTYGPSVDGFIPGAKYSMKLHELFIGYVRKI